MGVTRKLSVSFITGSHVLLLLVEAANIPGVLIMVNDVVVVASHRLRDDFTTDRTQHFPINLV